MAVDFIRPATQKMEVGLADGIRRHDFPVGLPDHRFDPLHCATASSAPAIGSGVDPDGGCLALDGFRLSQKARFLKYGTQN